MIVPMDALQLPVALHHTAAVALEDKKITDSIQMYSRSDADAEEIGSFASVLTRQLFVST